MMAPFFSLLVALAMPAMSLAAAIPQDDFTLIVGGSPAASGEFPYIVSLQNSRGSHFCGGSLLNANTVITAGHCAEGQTASALRVRAGTLTFSSGGTLVGVSSITIHPNFEGIDWDVAILHLSTPIPASSTVGYARLPASGSDPAAGSQATVAGWGATRENGAVSSTLLKVTVPVVSRADCRAVYGSDVTDRMWCAGTPEGGKDSCQGDSGGPIVDSSGTLIGLVSWGDGCARPGVPGVYARVASFIPFITAND